MRSPTFVQKTAHLILLLLLLFLSTPTLAHANEGYAWMYFIMAPFALFTIPFFTTSLFVAIAAYCYWQYRSTGKKMLGTLAVLALLVAIPIAVQGKYSYEVNKLQREDQKHNLEKRFPTTPLDTDRAIILPGRANGGSVR